MGKVESSLPGIIETNVVNRGYMIPWLQSSFTFRFLVVLFLCTHCPNFAKGWSDSANQLNNKRFDFSSINFIFHCNWQTVVSRKWAKYTSLTSVTQVFLFASILLKVGWIISLPQHQQILLIQRSWKVCSPIGPGKCCAPLSHSITQPHKASSPCICITWNTWKLCSCVYVSSSPIILRSQTSKSKTEREKKESLSPLHSPLWTIEGLWYLNFIDLLPDVYGVIIIYFISVSILTLKILFYIAIAIVLTPMFYFIS